MPQDGSYYQRDRGWHPPAFTPDYKTSVLRSPQRALLSLEMGFLAVGIAVVLGILLGLPAGYFGGATDMLVMRVMDVLLAFPSILLALSVVSILGPSLINAMVAVSVSVIQSW